MDTELNKLKGYTYLTLVEDIFYFGCSEICPLWKQDFIANSQQKCCPK